MKSQKMMVKIKLINVDFLIDIQSWIVPCQSESAVRPP